MSIERQMAEDRTMRDAALRLFKTDLALVRGDLSARGAGARATDRISDAAMDTFEDAIDYAQDHRGQVVGALAAILLWVFRGPLLGGLAALVGAGAAPADEHDESDADDRDWNDRTERRDS